MIKFAAAVLLLCSPAQAKPKARTLSDLVALTIKTGSQDEISAANAAALGLKAADAATKNVWIDESDAPDGQMHIFDVVLAGKKPKADCVTFSVKSSTETDDGVFLDGLWFRASVEGKLLGAMSFSGRAGEIFRTPLPVDDPKTRARFEKERDFWLNDSVALPVKNE